MSQYKIRNRLGHDVFRVNIGPNGSISLDGGQFSRSIIPVGPSPSDAIHALEQAINTIRYWQREIEPCIPYKYRAK